MRCLPAAAAPEWSSSRVFGKAEPGNCAFAGKAAEVAGDVGMGFEPQDLAGFDFAEHQRAEVPRRGSIVIVHKLRLLDVGIWRERIWCGCETGLGGRPDAVHDDLACAEPGGVVDCRLVILAEREPERKSSRFPDGERFPWTKASSPSFSTHTSLD